MPVKKEGGGGNKKRKRGEADDTKENIQPLQDSQDGADVTKVKVSKQKTSARGRSKRVKTEEAAAQTLQESDVNVERDADTNGAQERPYTKSEIVASNINELSQAPPRRQTRIILGVNINELSSDSDLTDVPDDIGPDPFLPIPSTKTRRRVKKEQENVEVIAAKEAKNKPKAKKTSLTKSPYFPHPHKPRPHFLSTLPFPPLHTPTFGLMQERLNRDPFRLLLATIFLNKTPGARAMPIFYQLMAKYPTPQDLANAEQPDVTKIIRELGFQNQRARKCIAMANMWVQDTPVKNRRWRKLGYPLRSDGKDVKEGEVIDDEDTRVAWEISHLPGLGPYSHDSWRMFCRDQLRGLSSGYNGEDADDGFEPEWKRVLPLDKELRAWMTWAWMKEGWVWNKETGERTKASDELMELARGKGNVVLESESNTLMVKSLDESQPSPARLGDNVKKDVRVEAPAGDFMPKSRGVSDGQPQIDSGVG